MAAVIIPRDQLRIPEHLRGRLERPALRVVAPPGRRPTTVVPLRAPARSPLAPGGSVAFTGRAVRPATGVRPGVATRRPPVAPIVPEQLVVRPERGGVARLVVAACLAIVALTGGTALVAGGPTEAPAPVVAPAGVASPAPTGDVWVVQPGDSLWSIAAAVAPGTDLRPVVDELARRAGGGGLQPGQRIAIDGIVP